LKLYISENSVFQDQDIFSKNRPKIIKKYFAGLCPAPPPYGAAPLLPIKVVAKCLAAVVLAHPDRALGRGRENWTKRRCNQLTGHI